VKKADAILTDSRFSAAEIAGASQRPSDRLFRIPPRRRAGIQEAAPGRHSGNPRRALGLGDRTCSRRHDRAAKNLPLLVEAFERLDDFDGDLVIAGMAGWKFEPILARIHASPKAARIRRLSVCPRRTARGALRRRRGVRHRLVLRRLRAPAARGHGLLERRLFSSPRRVAPRDPGNRGAARGGFRRRRPGRRHSGEILTDTALRERLAADWRPGAPPALHGRKRPGKPGTSTGRCAHENRPRRPLDIPGNLGHWRAHPRN